MSVVFYDGTKKTVDEVCEIFDTEFEWVKEKSGYYSLIYFCHDGDYQNVVPPNVYIFQMNFGSGHITHTEWLTQKEFDRYFEIVKPQIR